MSMKPVRVFRHVANEGPGYMAEVLERRGIPMQLVALDQGDAIPESLDEVSALVFMGGPMSANDPLEWIGDELRLIARAVEAGLPILGHCLGGQLISKALGARVVGNPVKEIGWFTVTGREESGDSPWLEGYPEHGVELFHWHGETFELPEGAVPLLASQWCENQAYALDAVLALQCHVEMLPEMVTDWAVAYADELSQPGRSVQTAQQMTGDLARRVSAMQRVADRLYNRWLDLIEA